MRLKLSKIIDSMIRLLYISTGLIVVILGMASLLIPILPGFVFIFAGLSVMAKGTSKLNSLKEYFSFSNFFLYIIGIFAIIGSFWNKKGISKDIEGSLKLSENQE
jgi:uncharacterized protein YqgC (DUF456 family)